MKLLIVTAALIIIPIASAFTQKYDFIFYTRYGGVNVYVNGELDGTIGDNGRYKVKVKYDEENPAYKLRLQKEGFEDKVFNYATKPDNNSTKIFWAMRKKRFRLEKPSNITFDLTKVKFDIAPNTQVSSIPGRQASWGSIGIEEADAEAFKDVINNELTITGFKGLCDSNSDENLFNSQTEKSARAKADVSIGALIKDLKITGKNIPYQRSLIYDLNVKMEVEWQFFDNKSEKFLIRSTTSEESYMVKETGELVTGINMAFAENFAAALNQDKVIKAIMSAKTDSSEKESESTSKKITVASLEVTNYTNSSDMIKDLNWSVVTVKSYDGHGSGFIIGEQGYVLTNYHVVEQGNDLEAWFPTGIKLPLELINYNKEFDLALLKVVGHGYRPISISSGTCNVGEEVLAIGTPSSTELTNTVTKGIISGKRNSKQEVELIQTDVSVSPGNSGSPLINSKGEVIGIISQKIVGHGTEGIAFALPISFALDKLNITVE